MSSMSHLRTAAQKRRGSLPSARTLYQFATSNNVQNNIATNFIKSNNHSGSSSLQNNSNYNSNNRLDQIDEHNKSESKTSLNTSNNSQKPPTYKIAVIEKSSNSINNNNTNENENSSSSSPFHQQPILPLSKYLQNMKRRRSLDSSTLIGQNGHLRLALNNRFQNTLQNQNINNNDKFMNLQNLQNSNFSSCMSASVTARVLPGITVDGCDKAVVAELDEESENENAEILQIEKQVKISDVFKNNGSLPSDINVEKCEGSVPLIEDIKNRLKWCDQLTVHCQARRRSMSTPEESGLDQKLRFGGFVCFLA